MGRLSGRGLGSRLAAPPSRLRRVVASPTVQADTAPRRAVSWYKTARWQKLRRVILKRDGYVCQATGVLLVGKYPADNSPVVDHKIPHRGDEVMFWDESNLWSVAKSWHDKVKQGMEKRGEI